MILHYFLNGLPRVYQEELARHTYTTYDEAYPIIWRTHTARHPELYAVYTRTEPMDLDMYGRGRRQSSSRSLNRIRSSSRGSRGTSRQSRSPYRHRSKSRGSRGEGIRA